MPGSHLSRVYSPYRGPPPPVREAWLVCGRRAGKSLVLAGAVIRLNAATDSGFTGVLPQLAAVPCTGYSARLLLRQRLSR